MRFEGPVRYRIVILPGPGLFEITGTDGNPKLPAEARSSLPKLYVVTVDEAPIYVGVTRQSIRSRLRFGFAAKGEHGYHGYRWRHHYNEVALDLWCNVDTSGENPMLDVETIEAEIVFLIRQQTGEWPAHQTEIHFHPSKPDHRGIAETIARRYL
jgi:hypothetical protein